MVTKRLLGVVLVALLVLGIATLPPSAKAEESGKVIIPAPCPLTKPYNAKASMSELRDGIAENWGFRMVGSMWTDSSYRPLVKTIWQTLDAISCPPYLTTLMKTMNGQLTLNATSIPGWPAGDYGLTMGGAVSLDFPQLLTSYQSDPGHVSRLFVHELTHAYTSNRFSNPEYWTEFSKIYGKLGKFGGYGDDQSEAFSEVIGFYVARCAEHNPYTPREAAYYEYAKKIFGGKEFGPALGKPLVCDAKKLAEQTAAEEAARYAESRAVAEQVAAQREAVRAQIEKHS